MENVVIYGAGNMGKAVWELLQDRCNVIGFMDGNPALKGSKISGVPVYHLSDTDAAKSLCDAVALVAMTICPFSSTKDRLLKFGFDSVEPAGDYVAAQYAQDEILNTWSAQDFCDKPLFSDEKSVSDYRAACQWFSRRRDEDSGLESGQYFPEFLSRQIDSCLVMLDTAALDGGYIDRFLSHNAGRSTYSYVLTPPTSSIKSLRETYQNRPVSFFDCEAAGQNGVVSCRRIGLMWPFTQERFYSVSTQTIDTAMKNKAFDYLRCYSMSEALPILQGGEQSIQNYRPIIAVNIGHYQTDFFQIPSYLMEHCSGYQFYFRMHSYQGNNCILYAVPNER